MMADDGETSDSEGTSGSSQNGGDPSNTDRTDRMAVGPVERGAAEPGQPNGSHESASQIRCGSELEPTQLLCGEEEDEGERLYPVQ